MGSKQTHLRPPGPPAPTMRDCLVPAVPSPAMRAPGSGILFAHLTKDYVTPAGLLSSRRKAAPQPQHPTSKLPSAQGTTCKYRSHMPVLSVRRHNPSFPLAISSLGCLYVANVSLPRLCFTRLSPALSQCSSCHLAASLHLFPLEFSTFECR